MGDLYRQMGDNEAALGNYKISLDICRQIGVRVGVSSNFSNMAMVYTALDSTNKALELLNEALMMNREINDREGTASIIIKIGDLYAKLNNVDKAIDYYQQALAIAQTLQDPRLFQRTYFPLGKQERRAGRMESAREHLEKSIQVADSLRRSVLSQNMRASYFASIHSCFDELLLLFMGQHRQNPDSDHDRQVLQVSERSRGQSLLEMLNESQVDLRASVDPALLERELRVRQELNAKAQQRQRMVRGELDADKLKALETEIRTLLIEHENLENRIRQQQPRLAAIEQADALPFKKIQSDVLDDSTLLIEYALIGERSFAWVVSSDTIECFELPPAAEIDSSARLVYQNLTARNVSNKDESAAQRQDRIQASDKQLQAAMCDLSDKILFPLVGRFNKPRLVFVCDEILQYIPFGAMPTPDIEKKNMKTYDPLVNHFQILSVPSASALPLIRQEKQRVSRPEKLIAMFADPVFSADDPRFSLQVPAQQDSAEPIVYAHLDKALQESGVGTRSDLSRLPFSRREASDIILLAGHENCSCFLDFNANYSQASSAELSNFKIIHFATHGIMNNMHPELSGLVLSLYDQQGKPQNGFLRLHDIYQLDLNADLVVLSACQTALGKDIRGEGLIGLTRGFMYAGVPQVVASLWKVDDEATAELMKRFYQYMLGEEQLPATAALRKAQISIMNEERWQSPYYWAGFILQGDWK
jgi:CHAT domain-containing protein